MVPAMVKQSLQSNPMHDKGLLGHHLRMKVTCHDMWKSCMPSVVPRISPFGLQKALTEVGRAHSTLLGQGTADGLRGDR